MPAYPNIVQNPTFSGWTYWTKTINGLENMSKHCSPVEGDCQYYSTCPFADENLDNQAWFLDGEWAASGETATVYLEAAINSADVKQTGIQLVSGYAYQLEAWMWKEYNYSDSMYVGVYTISGSLIARTDSFETCENQQSSTRTLVKAIENFYAPRSEYVYIEGHCGIKKRPSFDIDTPCADNCHAGFDVINLWQQTSGQ